MPDSTIVNQETELRKKILGVKIRHARTRAGLNLKEVAKALGLSVDSIADIEFGRHDVSLPQLEALALIYNIPATYFWSDETLDEPNLNYPTQEAMALRSRIIGTLLRQARTEAGRTQEDLANILNVPASRIANYEYGKADIPLQELEVLTQYLKVSLDYFLDQGIAPNAAINKAPTLDDIVDYAQLSPEVKAFVSNPANTLYINVAMKLSKVSADTLRALAEGLLEVTY